MAEIFATPLIIVLMFIVASSIQWWNFPTKSILCSWMILVAQPHFGLFRPVQAEQQPARGPLQRLQPAPGGRQDQRRMPRDGRCGGRLARLLLLRASGGGG